MAVASRLLILIVASIALLSKAVDVDPEPVDPSEEMWTYDNNGADWTMGDCGFANLTQSPRYLTKETIGMAWSEVCDVSFLSAWSAANITEADHGFTNYTYRINATDGNMGSFYAVEPFVSNAQLLWDVSFVRFHYPAEHNINGDDPYDLEMQIHFTERYQRAQWCSSYKGALSLFFRVADTQDDDFWGFVGHDTF
jgi:hypothetical protein